MKKSLCLILSLVLCCSVLFTPIAHAKAVDEAGSQENVTMDIPVVDTEGNVMLIYLQVIETEEDKSKFEDICIVTSLLDTDLIPF